MRQRDGRFAGKGKRREIFWQAWLPDTPSRASVVIAHGAAEHGGRYAPLAERLVADGYGVYAVDHRGHGKSTGARSLIDRLDRALADLDHVVEIAAEDDGGRRPYLLGHSMGGCFALQYALDDPSRIAGLILSGPLVDLKDLRLLLFVSRLLATLAPRLGVYGVESSAISRDPEQVRRYEEDPLNYRGKLPVGTVAEFAGAIAGFRRRVGDLRLPLLILQGGADRIVPPAGATALAELAGSEDKTFKLYPELYHEIFNESEPDRSAVIADLVAWLTGRVGSTPARAGR